MRFQAPRGTEDVLPSDAYRWHHLEQAYWGLTRRYGYEEIRTPTFEDTDLFLRNLGETSDVVTKEMYTFVDKGDRSVTLKPEGTAPVMRAIIEHSLCPPGAVLRLAYESSFFRYGRPQKGRLRELHQLGLELVGAQSVAADAEIIEIAYRFFTLVGLPEAEVTLNSIGREECRARYREVVLKHVEPYLKDEPEEARLRAERNPLGMLDTKDPGLKAALQGVPSIVDYLEDASKERFEKLQQLLTDAGVKFRLDPMTVRGLDYYTETVFEVESPFPDVMQTSLCGGGRYDGLVEKIGGAPTPSVGFGIGIERTLLVLEAKGRLPGPPRPDAFVVQAGPEAEAVCRTLARELRAAGATTLTDIEGRSMKSQLRQADKASARFAVIVGKDEMDAGVAQIRNLDGGAQETAPLDQVVAKVTGRP